MLRSLLLSIGQLGDRAVMRVFAKSMAVTLALFAVGGIATWWLIDTLLARWAGADAPALAAVAATLVALLAAWLLFRAIAVAVVGLFADEIVVAVEARHYPEALANGRALPFARSAAMGLRAALRVVAANLVLAPVYIALLVTGVGTGIAFLLVNGWLLGRDLGDMVAARHLDAGGMQRWRRATAGRRFLLGVGGTVSLAVPVVNLVVPVLGAAMATHLFHARRP